MIVNPEHKMVTLSLPARTIQLALTNQPVPPAPPTQTGAASSLRVRSNTPGAAILKAFGKVLEPEPSPALHPFDDEEPFESPEQE